MPLPDAIRKSPIVFLTGAGASVPLGLPATAGFLARFVEAMPRRLAGATPELWRFASERLTQRQPGDIEVVLQELEAVETWAKQFGADFSFAQSAADFFRPTLSASADVADVAVSGLADQLSRDLQAMCTTFASWSRRVADAIYDEVIECYGSVAPTAAADLYRGLLGVMDQFEAVAPLRTVPLFTLNYDIAVEQAVDGLGLGIVDGFVGGAVGRRWTPRAYHDYNEKPDVITVVLVKLHGSVRLGRTEGGALIELPAGTYRDPPPHRHAVLYPSLGPKSLDEEPYRANYSMLRACLMHARLFVVIGSTLRDTELNVLIRGCLEENEQLYLVVLGPEANSADTAQRIGCERTRVGGAVGCFDVEDPDVLKFGRGRILNALRRWWMSRGGGGPHTYGADHEL